MVVGGLVGVDAGLLGGCGCVASFGVKDPLLGKTPPPVHPKGLPPVNCCSPATLMPVVWCYCW
jgi:hypothetical protein